MSASLTVNIILKGVVPRLSKLTTTLKPLVTMMDATSIQVLGLEKRLDEAERRARLLMGEIKKIARKITELRAAPVMTANASNEPRPVLPNPPRTATATSTVTTSPSQSERRTLIDLTDSFSPERQPLSSAASSYLNHAKRRTAQEPNADEGAAKKSKVGYEVVYTDGACENNGRANARAGFGVWFGHGDPRNISKPVTGRATNNTAEIQACIAAIETCLQNGHKKILIKTDSEFTINCMTKWIKGWKKKGWRKANGEPVINKTDLEVLDKLCAQVEIEWEHVRGHQGVEGNEEADKLARLGAQAYSS